VVIRENVDGRWRIVCRRFIITTSVALLPLVALFRAAASQRLPAGRTTTVQFRVECGKRVKFVRGSSLQTAIAKCRSGAQHVPANIDDLPFDQFAERIIGRRETQAAMACLGRRRYILPRLTDPPGSGILAGFRQSLSVVGKRVFGCIWQRGPCSHRGEGPRFFAPAGSLGLWRAWLSARCPNGTRAA